MQCDMSLAQCRLPPPHCVWCEESCRVTSATARCNRQAFTSTTCAKQRGRPRGRPRLRGFSTSARPGTSTSRQWSLASLPPGMANLSPQLIRCRDSARTDISPRLRVPPRRPTVSLPDDSDTRHRVLRRSMQRRYVDAMVGPHRDRQTHEKCSQFLVPSWEIRCKHTRTNVWAATVR